MGSPLSNPFFHKWSTIATLLDSAGMIIRPLRYPLVVVVGSPVWHLFLSFFGGSSLPSIIRCTPPVSFGCCSGLTPVVSCLFFFCSGLQSPRCWTEPVWLFGSRLTPVVSFSFFFSGLPSPRCWTEPVWLFCVFLRYPFLVAIGLTPAVSIFLSFWPILDFYFIFFVCYHRPDARPHRYDYSTPSGILWLLQWAHAWPVRMSTPRASHD